MIKSEFQSTLPRRERRSPNPSKNLRYLFQSTLPRRERRLLEDFSFAWYNFNPRSREGSDLITNIQSPGNIISIHAPAKGATQSIRQWKANIPISIHAPAKGATASGAFVTTDWEFQSTLPRRERPYAKTTGAVQGDFNPRSREGSDKYFILLIHIFVISIHAPAKGATKKQVAIYGAIKKISIHAPAKGATYP